MPDETKNESADTTQSVTKTKPESLRGAFASRQREAGERIRRFDWSGTPLGPAGAWSPALRAMVARNLAFADVEKPNEKQAGPVTVATAEPDMVTAGPSPGLPHLLLAEDNPDLCLYLQRLLAPYYRVETVPDGQAALERAQAHPPDLLLTDVLMPRLDGIGLLRKIRADQHTSGIPVILLSGRASEEDRQEGLGTGADDYLSKPFSATELLARLRSLLEIGRLRRESANYLQNKNIELAKRVAELQSASIQTENARRAALNLMEDAVLSRRLAESLHGEVRASEERYRDLLNSIDEGFCTAQLLFDAAGRPVDHRILEVNPAFTKQSGLPEPVDRLMSELAPGYEQYWNEIYGRVVTTGKSVRVERRMEVLGRWLDVFVSRVGPATDGKVAIVFTDSTARKKAAEHLRLLWAAAKVLLSTNDSHAMLLALLAKIGPGLGLDTYFSYLVDETSGDLRLVSFAGVARKLTHRVLKMEFSESVDGIVALRHKPVYIPWVQQSSDVKTRAIKSFGLRAYVCHPLMSGKVMLGTLAFGSHSKDEFGPDELAVLEIISHYVGLAYERLLHAEVLRISELRYRRLFEAAHDGILILDPGTRKITGANPFMTRLLRYSRRELIGKELFEIGLFKDEAASRRMFRNLRSKRKIRYEDLPLESEEGGRHEVEVVANLYHENKRAVIQCNIRDITARKVAEAQKHRLDMITVSNDKLRREIVRRQAVELALRKSEQATRHLLDQARSLQQELRRMSHRILEGLENQRRKISRELHDDISQILVGINVHLAVFAKTAELDPAGVHKAIAPLHDLVEKSLKIVHRFARELRPSSLDDLGLIPAIKAYIEDFPKQKGLHISFTAFAGVESLNNDKRTMLYRITQEALTNVAKHARASRVQVRIGLAKGQVRLDIIDNGRAFVIARIASARWRNRLGLIGMRERVEMLGGNFSVTSKRGTGTRVRAEIPFGEIGKWKTAGV